MSSSLSILIVEDDKVLQEVYAMILSSAGHQVYTADNGAEGLVLLKRHRPNLILLDLFMPVLDGKEFLRNFDKREYKDISIIVYSNLSDSKVQQEMIDLGADRYILKSSLTPDDLLSMVIEYTGSANSCSNQS